MSGISKPVAHSAAAAPVIRVEQARDDKQVAQQASRAAEVDEDDEDEDDSSEEDEPISEDTRQKSESMKAELAQYYMNLFKFLSDRAERYASLSSMIYVCNEFEYEFFFQFF